MRVQSMEILLATCGLTFARWPDQPTDQLNEIGSTRSNENATVTENGFRDSINITDIKLKCLSVANEKMIAL